MGWQTIAKAMEHQVNNLPLGYLLHQGEKAPLLSILRPNLLKLNTASERAPSGLFDVPNRASDLMHKTEQIYDLWYRVWCNDYIPIIARMQKWFHEEENLEESDIVYFKLTDSPLASNWRVGKVEYTMTSKDGKVRTVGVSYNHDTEDGQKVFKIVDRPVRQVVKLMNIDDTTIIEDIQKVHMDARKRIGDQRLVKDNAFDNNLEEPRVENAFDTNLNSASYSLIKSTYFSYTVRNKPVRNSVYLKEEKFAFLVQTPSLPVNLDKNVKSKENDAFLDWENLFFNVNINDDDDDLDAENTEIILI